MMVIRSRKSKKDKQYNGKRKRTKGQTETVHRKSKTSNMNPTKIGVSSSEYAYRARRPW